MKLKNLNNKILLYIIPGLGIISFILNIYINYSFEDTIDPLKQLNLLNNNLINVIYLVLLSTILGPILEEIIFRYWLKDFDRRTNFKILLFGLCTINLFEFITKNKFNLLEFEYYTLTKNLIINYNQSWLLYFQYSSKLIDALIIVIFYYCSTKLFDNIKITNKFTINPLTNFLFIIFSSIVFTLSHFNTHSIGIFIFFNLFYSALFLSFIRIKYSFKLSIILHMLNNVSVIFIALLFTEGEESYLGILQIIVTLMMLFIIGFYFLESKYILKRIDKIEFEK